MQKKMMSDGKRDVLMILLGTALSFGRTEEKKKMTKKFLKKELSREPPVRGAIERVV